ncbi:MAG: fused response regulator/phosphatase [Spirochaetales bacterium]|nr:fused response regulator/phosphatase [Spirochaetales bacterium]
MEKMKIVLVDDEPEVLRALERELFDLSDESDMELMKFDSPLQGLSYIELHSDSVALVISDQKMPVMKGCDFLEKVKELNESIISILLTAHTEIEDIIRTIRTGLFSFILKPWQREPLILEVEKALVLYNLRKEKDAYVRKLNEELRWGGELQKLLLSRPFPVDKRIAFSICYSPVPQLYCSGDYYDVFSFDKDRFMVLIGDVAGHGVKAAFVTFIIKTLINEVVERNRDHSSFKPSELLFWLNKRICHELDQTQAMIVTFCACLVDLKRRDVTVSNGGHVHPLVLRDGSLFPIESNGTALGFDSELEFFDSRESLEAGDRLLLFTDGLPEAELEDTSFENVLLLTSTAGDLNFSQKVIDSIQGSLSNRERTDDMTLLSVEINSL